MLIFEPTERVLTSTILAALREAAKATSGELTPAAYLNSKAPGGPSTKVIYARFGSWPAALRSAGLR